MRQQTLPGSEDVSKRINLKVDPELHRALKMEAVRRGVTLQALVERWLTEKLETARSEQ